MKKAIFPGSFDPLTLGHCEIIEKATQIFDELIVSVGNNSEKKYKFNLDKRLEFILENYPETDFALDSQFKLELIQEILASKEMYLAKYYIEKEKWIPAINRYRNVLDKFEDVYLALCISNKNIKENLKIYCDKKKFNFNKIIFLDPIDHEENLKRISSYNDVQIQSNDFESPYIIKNFMEAKTTWHPIEFDFTKSSNY